METYVSQQKKQLLDSLENQARFSQLVAVIVGEKGIGKSFLIQQLNQRLEDELATARIDASLAMTEDQLEKTIGLQLGLNWQETEIGLEQRIKNELQQKVLISIDDAHLLSSSCLEFILQLNQNQLQLQESVLFILLAGSSSLPGLINETITFKHHQEMCVVFQIEPLQQHETKAIVADFCSLLKDWHNDSYDEKKLDYFWQLSKGNPAELNYHVSRWLEENSETKIVEISEEGKTSYLRSFLYVLVVAVLVGTLFFQNDINQWIAIDSNTDLSAEENAHGQVEKLSLEKDPGAKSKVKDDYVEPVVESPLQSSTTEPADKSQKEELSNQSNPETETEKTAKKVAENKQIPAEENTIKNVPAEKPQVAKNKDKKEIEKAESAPVTRSNEVKTEHSKNTLNLNSEEISLLKQDDKLFVLQWVGLSKLKAATQYRKEHPLADKMVIYRRASNGQVLYLVISDQFLSRMLADVAKAEYKKRSYPGKPWVKSMAAVKKEIAAFKDSGIR